MTWKMTVLQQVKLCEITLYHFAIANSNTCKIGRFSLWRQTDRNGETERVNRSTSTLFTNSSTINELAHLSLSEVDHCTTTNSKFSNTCKIDQFSLWKQTDRDGESKQRHKYIIYKQFNY